jgi:hypothetical protein
VSATGDRIASVIRGTGPTTLFAARKDPDPIASPLTNAAECAIQAS